MNMPGFSAQASLYRTDNRYRSVAGEPQGTGLIPQLGGPGFEGRAFCISKCIDENPGLTAKQCAARCRDPGGTPGTGGGRKPDPSVEILCDSMYMGCAFSGHDAYLGALCATRFFTGYGGPCSCEELKDRCLSD
jgi:hypothetical protein